MIMNRFGRAILNSRARAFAQRAYVIPTLHRLGADLTNACVLEIGCGCGVGAELVLDACGAARVDAIDLDPAMIERASGRLGDRATVCAGDMTHLDFDDATYDAVTDFGGIHLVPEWRQAVDEIARVLRPGGQYVFEQIAKPWHRRLLFVATGRSVPGGFGKDAYFEALAGAGLAVRDFTSPRWLPMSGAVGDLIGIAHKT